MRDTVQNVTRMYVLYYIVLISYFYTSLLIVL